MANRPINPQEQLQWLIAAIRVELGLAEPPGNQAAYAGVVGCLKSSRCLRVECGPIRKKLSPYRLIFTRGTWHVVGRSSWNRSVRVFSLNEIR